MPRFYRGVSSEMARKERWRLLTSSRLWGMPWLASLGIIDLYMGYSASEVSVKELLNTPTLRGIFACSNPVASLILFGTDPVRNWEKLTFGQKASVVLLLFNKE